MWLGLLLLLTRPAHADDAATQALCTELLRARPSTSRVAARVAAGADIHSSCLLADHTNHAGNLGNIGLSVLTAGLWALVGPRPLMELREKRVGIVDLVLSRGDAQLLTALIGDDRADQAVGRAFTRLVAEGEVSGALFAGSALAVPKLGRIPATWADPQHRTALLDLSPAFHDSAELVPGPDWARHPDAVVAFIDSGLPPASAMGVASDWLGGGEVAGAAALAERGVPLVLRSLAPSVLDDAHLVTSLLAVQPQLALAHVAWGAAVADGSVLDRLDQVERLVAAGAPSDLGHGALSAAISLDRLDLASSVAQRLPGLRPSVSLYPLALALHDQPDAAARRQELQDLGVQFRYLDVADDFWAAHLDVLDRPDVMAFLEATEVPLCPLIAAGRTAGADLSLVIATHNDLGPCASTATRVLDAGEHALGVRLARDLRKHEWEQRRVLTERARDTSDAELLAATIEMCGIKDFDRALTIGAADVVAVELQHLYLTSDRLTPDRVARMREVDLALVLQAADQGLLSWENLLFSASKAGDEPLVTALLAAGRFDQDDLSSALARGRQDLAVRLVDSGVRPSAHNLHRALEGGQWQAAAAFIEVGVTLKPTHISLILAAPSPPPAGLVAALRAGVHAPLRWTSACLRKRGWPQPARQALCRKP